MHRTRRYMQGVLLPLVVVIGLVIMGSHHSQAGPPVPDVQVVNPPEKPVPVQEVGKPAKEIFRWRDNQLMDNRGWSGFTNESNKRILIKFLSFYAFASSTQPEEWIYVMFYTMKIGDVSTIIPYHTHLSRMGRELGNTDVFMGNSQVHVYVEPGERVNIRVDRNPDGGPFRVDMAISGYYEDVPPAPTP